MGTIPDVTHFYPRSPCGERQKSRKFWALYPVFLSTLSLRRATTQMQAAFKGPEISIHALLAESDPRGCPASSPRPYFYPRSPCGERHPKGHTHYMGVYISIHALLAESDPSLTPKLRLPRNFYPRSPCGERRAGRGHVASRHQISIHALLAESDQVFQRIAKPFRISIHALLAESDWNNPQVTMRTWRFLSTLSLRRATYGA